MIFRHIVVAVDFSSAWDRIHADLPKLRGWGCERLSPVHVLASHYPQVPAVGHREHYQQRLDEIITTLTRSGFQADGRIAVGDPARELIETARKLGADCLLAGSHGHNTLRDFFLGSTVLNLARLTPLPLLLIPVHADVPPAATLNRVLLATDCSTAAQAPERVFLALVDAGAVGIAVCAAERGSAEDLDRENTCAKTHMERLIQRTDQVLDTRIVRGAAPEVIIRTARETGADLVIVGKRGHNLLRELLLGSTAEAVCRQAECPVLVVPSAANPK